MYNVCTGPYVQCTYMSVRILYVNDLENDLFLRKAVDSYGNLHFKMFENSLKIIP